MFGMYFFILILALSHVLVRVSPLVCLNCEGLFHPRHCTYVQHCNNNQACFTRVRDHFGQLQYETGCVEEMGCKNASSTSCFECCSGDLCNINGCGTPELPANVGPVCYNCRGVSNTTKCREIDVCAENEICYLEEVKQFGETLHFMQCSDHSVCANHNDHYFPGAIGKRGNKNRSSATHSYSCCNSSLCNAGVSDVPEKPAESCKEHYDNGWKRNGVYSLMINNVTFQAYCEMSSGGWTYVQRRIDGSLLFNRTMQEYIDGFGNVYGEHWIGLKYIHLLSMNGVQVQFDLVSENGTILNASYSNFMVSDNGHTYRLSVSGYYEINSHGLLSSDLLDYNNNRVFAISCIRNRFGWWFSGCTYNSINGQYGLKNDENGFTVHPHGRYVSLKSSIMKLK